MINTVSTTLDLFSVALNRKVIADMILPANFDKSKTYPLLILNDGQDMKAMGMQNILFHVWDKKICRPFILVAPHAKQRIDEYGVAGIPDFKKRGNLATEYTHFIVNELIPQLFKVLDVFHFDEIVMGGFSLGGLSAFDIAWNQPHLFTKVGVCSGSFWWRSKGLNDGYQETDKIIQKVVRDSTQKPELKVWLQCGTLDETADRNNNGIIDSIDDTYDLIVELETKGFVRERDLFYNESIGGRHTLETYSIMLPYFFQWAFRA